MMPATVAWHQWTSADYERMLAAGMFEKIELLCGEVVITGAGVHPAKKKAGRIPRRGKKER